MPSYEGSLQQALQKHDFVGVASAYSSPDFGRDGLAGGYALIQPVDHVTRANTYRSERRAEITKRRWRTCEEVRDSLTPDARTGVDSRENGAVIVPIGRG